MNRLLSNQELTHLNLVFFVVCGAVCGLCHRLVAILCNIGGVLGRRSELSNMWCVCVHCGDLWDIEVIQHILRFLSSTGTQRDKDGFCVVKQVLCIFQISQWCIVVTH